MEGSDSGICRMRHTARIGRTSFWAKAVGCAMGRGDSVLRRGEGRAGARERCPRTERGSRAGGNARPGSEMAELGGKAEGPGEGVVPKREADPGTQERGTRERAKRRGAANGGRSRRRAQQDL